MAELFYGSPIFPGTSELDQLSKIFQITGTPNVLNHKLNSIYLSEYYCSVF